MNFEELPPEAQELYNRGTPTEKKELLDLYGRVQTYANVVQMRPEQDAPEDIRSQIRAMPVNWHELWDMEFAEEWLLEPIIPLGWQVVIYAKAGAGKSLFVLEMAAAIATGKAIFQQEAGHPKRVAYFDFENDLSLVKDRMVRFGRYKPDDLDNLLYFSLQKIPALNTPAGADWMEVMMDELNPDVIVIDTMARVIKGEENSADSYREFDRLTGLAIKSRGVSLVRIDHAGKNKDLGPRGSSSKNDYADLVLLMTVDERDDPTPSIVKLHADKRRATYVPLDMTFNRFESPHTFHQMIQAGYPEGTSEAVAAFDRLGIPTNWGRVKVIQYLKENDLVFRDRVIRAAIRSRKNV